MAEEKNFHKLVKEQYTFEDFVKIIEQLRAKDGCPWDREQTHDSLRSCMMEEAAELVGAIRIYDKTGNAENMQEELGDILLQVVMHSVIAQEEGLFTLEDVVQEVSEKMVRRHPHIFASGSADNADEVLTNWDEIKKQEKQGKVWIESALREIPQELPSLTRGPKVLKKIDKLYQKAPSYQETISAMEEAVQKLKSCDPEKEQKEIQNYLGDVLMESLHVARGSKFVAEQVLNDKIDDLIEHFEPLS